MEQWSANKGRVLGGSHPYSWWHDCCERIKDGGLCIGFTIATVLTSLHEGKTQIKITISTPPHPREPLKRSGASVSVDIDAAEAALEARISANGSEGTRQRNDSADGQYGRARDNYTGIPGGKHGRARLPSPTRT